jgi:histidinol-phosphate phosphatase family protein
MSASIGHDVCLDEPAEAHAEPMTSDPGPGTPCHRSRAAAFIDQDGTLLSEGPRGVDPNRLEFTPNAAEALQLLDAAGFALIVVTDQPGLASGRFTRREFAALEAALRRKVRDEAGVEVAGFFCCPHAQGADGRPACLCRKPAPGMLRQAARTHGLALARSWLIGDVLDDVEAGHRAGCRSILVDVGNETGWKTSPIRRPDAVCADLLEAAQVVVEAATPRCADAC